MIKKMDKPYIYNKNKIEDSSYTEKNGKIILYSEPIYGGRRFNNFIAVVLLFLFGLGFFIAGISSYFHTNIIPLRDFSTIEFLPQGILLLFYGTCSSLLSILITSLIVWDIGSGTNIYDIENQVVRVSRRGFPKIIDLRIQQENFYLVYSFNEIDSLELDIIGGINPKRVIFLGLKDGRRIPLTPSNEFSSLSFLENRAIFLAKFLQMDLKLNVEN
jgi:hypothetical protein|tara:strand:- start:123 stop:770 length:648 start_codon:yes stop_codon:yes gene_type:complete